MYNTVQSLWTNVHRSSLLAYLCIYHLPQQFGLSAYPAFGPARQFQAGWICHILARSELVPLAWRRIHERTILLRFLGIILRVLRLEVSLWIFLKHRKGGYGFLSGFPPFYFLGYSRNCKRLREFEEIKISSCSQDHEHTNSLRFLGILLRVLRLEVSVWIYQTIVKRVWFSIKFSSFFLYSVQ